MKSTICPSPPASANNASPVAGSISFYSLAVIISGVACIITCSISFFLILMHATHFSIPKEQRLIIRVIFCLPVFAVISLLDCWLTEASKYIEPWRNLYEAFALACFFLLLCTYISPDADQRERYFEGQELQNHRGEVLKNGYFARLKICWIGVFQFPVVTFILTLVEDISKAAGTFCPGSKSFHFANQWVRLLSLASTAIAIISLLRFYRATKPALAHHKTLLKLVAFKLIIFLSFVQKAVFTYGISSGTIKPTKTLTYNDINIGLPNLLIAIEAALIAVLFPFAYPSKPYHSFQPIHDPSKDYVPVDAPPVTHRGGFLGIKAFVQAIEIRDFLAAYPRGLQMLAGMQSRPFRR